MAADQPWAHGVYDYLKSEGVTQISYVPDAGHRVLIDKSLADDDMHSVALTTEEEGVAMAAGAWLGGEKHVLLMQSSGAGNCVNMFSLLRLGRFPFVTLLTMRGDFGEGNPWQMPMGASVEGVMKACDFVVLKVDTEDEVMPTIKAAMTMAYKSHQCVAVLLTQKLLGAKAF
ncbi:MAG: phosphonopyruvate decarboxylase [Alphaproteobacteria bacterium]